MVEMKYAPNIYPNIRRQNYIRLALRRRNYRFIVIQYRCAVRVLVSFAKQAAM